MRLFDGGPAEAEEFLPVGLAEDDGGGDEEHGGPEGGGDGFAEAEVGPAHGAEGNEVVEEVNFAGFPVAKGVVPDGEGGDAAAEDAEELEGDEVGADCDALGEGFDKREGNHDEAGAPECVGGNFGAGEVGGEDAALAAVSGPEDAGGKAEAFAHQARGALAEDGPEEGEDAAEGDEGGGVALGGFPVFLGQAFPDDGPDGGGAEVKGDVGDGGEFQGPVENGDVGGEAQAAAPPEFAFESGRDWVGGSEDFRPAHEGEHDQAGADETAAAGEDRGPEFYDDFGGGVGGAPEEDGEKDAGGQRGLVRFFVHCRGECLRRGDGFQVSFGVGEGAGKVAGRF